MQIERSTVLPFESAEIFSWFARSGALQRLLPPWMPGRVLREAQTLQSGRAVVKFPGGMRWGAQHLAQEYLPERRFVEEFSAGGSSPLLSRALRWRHEHLFEPVGPDAARVIDRIDTNLPSGPVARMLAYRCRQLSDDLHAHRRAAEAGMKPITVAVSGSSGMVGSALCAFLTTGGHTVLRLVRRAPRHSDERFWDPHEPDAELLRGCDAVIHLAGHSIFGRFTDQHRQAIESSRVDPTRKLAEVAAASGIDTFVSASAIGYYGAATGEPATEHSEPASDDFLSRVVHEWEQAARAASSDTMRRVQVRTGVVLSPQGGMLKVLRPIFAAGLGGRLGSGRQQMSWIGLDDLIDVYHRALWDSTFSGPVNAVAPEPVSNAEFTRACAAVLHRPAVLPVPELAPKLLLGSDGAKLLAMADQRIVPAVLQGAGHVYRRTSITAELAHNLGRMLE